ncbi:DUF7169 domain-containing protein [Curtobacterium flaccumfaciens]|uniref:DUF7169 domain-containing protein n=1 Tax=Curtobacterium flaccumfaciens TaxID=2035 RepID=UPI0039963352
MTTDTTATPGKLTNPTLHQSANLVMRLHYLLGSAAEVQWQRSRTISPDHASAEVIIDAAPASSRHVIGSVTDPTFDAATDPARLALRAAVKDAERVMAKQHAAMQEAAAILDAALTRWNGGA